MDCRLLALTLLVVTLFPFSFAAAADAAPATLTVAHRAELAALSDRSWDNGVRWCQTAVTKDGGVLVFYCDRQVKICYRYSADGKEFAEPVQVASGLCPAIALDAEDNVYLVFKGEGKRASFKKLPRTGPGQWDATGEVTQPLAQFGEGPINFPSVLILPGSGRIWCVTNYQTVDIFSKPKTVEYAARKPRGQAVVSYSDDGGKSWAEPVYVGSDSGDEGSGVVVLRPWRGQATWWWTFWDCATPAWGFFDGSRPRGLREIFPHTRSRMAVGHPWDTIEDPAGRLIFATGTGSYTSGQVYKVFDGSAWSEEIWLSDKRATLALLGDGQHVFCAAVEGGQVSLYQLDGTKPARRPVLYTAPEGKAIDRPIPPPPGRRAKGFVPLFLVEATPQKVGTRTRLEDMRLTYLRLEVKPLADAAPDAAPFDPATARNPEAYKPMPVGDERAEPRTDAPKDRRIVRVGGRWVMVWADDNPGRLLAAPLDAGKLGKPVALIDEPGWGRFQCSAAAVGDDELAAVYPGPDRKVVLVRLTGVKDWDKKPPKVVRTVSPAQDTWGYLAPAGNLYDNGWPSICAAGRAVSVAEVRYGGLHVFPGAGLGGHELVRAPGYPDPVRPRPSLVSAAGETVLLSGDDAGLWAGTCALDKPARMTKIVAEPWIGQHYSAVADGDRVDVIYTPAASHLGKKLIGHARREGGAWKQMPPVDTGNVIRGLSLCEVGGGRLLAVYCVRNPRPAEAAKGDEKMKRFTYTLYRRTFDGTAWSQPVKVTWPEVPKYRPANWNDWNEVGGVVYIPETDLGRFPTLPASSAGQASVPVAWMVPGFACMPKKERVDPDRGGLLVTTEIKVGEARSGK